MVHFSTLLEALTIGHAEEKALASGCTVLCFDRPVIASGIVAGGAPGGRDVALLAPEMSVQKVDALVLSGGSAFGLDAAGGAQAALHQQGRGLAIGGVRVPIVPSAIIFDLLNGGNKEWGENTRYWEMGFRAAQNTKKHTAIGSVGAGLGANTVNLKGGLGAARGLTASGFIVEAFMVVNAIGAATLGDSPYFWAAPYEQEEEFGGLGFPPSLTPAMLDVKIKGHNQPATTIGAIVTDAPLNKMQAHRVARMAQDGWARALRPVHAPMDGDTVFVAATGDAANASEIDNFALTALGAMAADCAARAIALAVYHAHALPFPNALPAWRDLYGAKS